MKDRLAPLASIVPYLIVFTASACTLILEIVAGRILAPVIGVSLYTWTSIIGVVLAGISVGNYAGGLIADRFPSRLTLGIILLISGIFTVIILPLISVVGEAVSSLPLLPRIVTLTAALFLPASVILGMVTPIVIKLELRELSKTGDIVGRFYAISTAGAILGVFLTGFVLIQWIGTRPIVLAVAIALFAMALLFGDLWKVRYKFLAVFAVAVIAISAALTVRYNWFDSDCDEESNYFCIKVRERTIQDQTVRTLTLDQLLHSYVAKEDPAFLVYGYEKITADFVALQEHRIGTPKVMFIGGGGYTMPRLIEHRYSDWEVEVIEIDPVVTRIAHEYLWLPLNTNIISYHEDARMKARELPQGTYDMVVGDAFNDFSVPYQLTTHEFNQQVKQLLKPSGIYIVNIVDNIEIGNFLRSYVNTMQHTFEHVYILRDDELWDDDERSNVTYVVVGSAQPITLNDLSEANEAVGWQEPITRFMPDDLYYRWFHRKDPAMLTDGFVPVDQMLAPVFLKSR
jgi:MFS family permease